MNEENNGIEMVAIDANKAKELASRIVTEIDLTTDTSSHEDIAALSIAIAMMAERAADKYGNKGFEETADNIRRNLNMMIQVFAVKEWDEIKKI